MTITTRSYSPNAKKPIKMQSSGGIQLKGCSGEFRYILGKNFQLISSFNKVVSLGLRL